MGLSDELAERRFTEGERYTYGLQQCEACGQRQMRFEFVKQDSLADPTGAYRIRGGKCQNPDCGHEVLRSDTQPL
jgi:hypothetical protein